MKIGGFYVKVMILKKIVVAFLLVLVCLSSPISGFAFIDDEWTIYTTLRNYQGAKFEPVKGNYLGAYLLQDVTIDGKMEPFNEMMGKDHGTFFRYVGYGRPFPREWAEEVKALGAIPQIAWEPNNGLKEVKDDDYLRNFAREANELDIPIFIRYASEMNGNWMAYSGNPSEYIEKWRLVYRVFQEEAPKAIMVWTVFTFPEANILHYYPGDDYVDWVGVNIYNVVYNNNNINTPAHQHDPLRLLDYVYDQFSHRKPIHISEYGVTHYTITDDKYYVDFAIEKLERLYGNLLDRYPRVKSISYFNVNTFVNAAYDRRINNYAITTEERIVNTYRELIKDERYLSTYQGNLGTWDETLSFNYRHFLHEGRLHVDLEFFIHNLGLNFISRNDSHITLGDGLRSITVPIVKRIKPRTFFGSAHGSNYNITGLPLRQIVEHFGYTITFDFDKKILHIK
jgi:hypothetical protein